jgi:protein archease
MPRTGRRRRWGSFPTTADEGLWARGGTPEELFEALGLGLFALMTDLRTVRRSTARTVRARGADPSELVVAWLGELLLLQQTEGLLLNAIRVRCYGRPPTRLIARVEGEPFDGARHPRRTEVKAITYHRLLVDPARGRARVIVDI